MDFDVFISHASEDKDGLVRPLAAQLEKRGLRVWFDETEIKLGDSLRRSIDYGLSKSRFGLVVLSPDFLRKEWPQKELDGLVAREDGSAKVILPIWHNVTQADIASYSPPLADKLAAPTSKGIAYVVEQVVRAVGFNGTSTRRFEEDHGDAQYPSHDFQDLMIQMLDRVQELAESGPQRVIGVPTGFFDLDLFTAGFQPASLTIVAGRKSSGKTAFALSAADHVACGEGLPVVIFCPNSSATSVTNRMICASGGIDPHHLRVGSLLDAEWQGLSEVVERFRIAALHIHDAHDLSFEDIQAECRRLLKLRGALGLVIVDSLQDLSQETRQGSDLGSICRQLKSLAREIRSPILVLTNLGRRQESRLDPRPTLEDLEEHGEIERYADLVLLLYRDVQRRTESGDAEVAELIVAKQSEGSPTGTVRLNFRSSVGRFENLSLGS